MAVQRFLPFDETHAQPEARTSRKPGPRPGLQTTDFSDIDLTRWKDYDDIITDSLWLLGARDRSGPHIGDYHGNFVPQIASQVIRRFTRADEVVLDLFAGMGTTLIECRRLGRHGIGVELQQSVAEKAKERIEQAPKGSTRLLVGDSRTPETAARVRQAIQQAGSTCAHHVILHPPYWDIIDFSAGECAGDLSRAQTEEAFYADFGQVVERAYELLMPGRFMTMVIGDKYAGGEWVPLGFGCMEVCRRKGFKLKAINVKDIQGNEKAKGKNNNLWRYRALRFGMYVFKHEYIMIFRKPRK